MLVQTNSNLNMTATDQHYNANLQTFIITWPMYLFFFKHTKIIIIIMLIYNLLLVRGIQKCPLWVWLGASVAHHPLFVLSNTFWLWKNLYILSLSLLSLTFCFYWVLSNKVRKWAKYYFKQAEFVICVNMLCPAVIGFPWSTSQKDQKLILIMYLNSQQAVKCPLPKVEQRTRSERLWPFRQQVRVHSEGHRH